MLSTNTYYTSLTNKRVECFEAYKARIFDIVNKFLGADWEICNFNSSILNIGFKNGKFYNSGNPQYTSIEIYHGENWPNMDDIRFEINPFTAGAFEPGVDYNLTKYYGGVGIFCNNTEFITTLKNTLREFSTIITDIDNKIYEIKYAENKRIETEKKIAAEIIEAKRVDDIKNELANKTANSVVIEKGRGGKFIYRKQSVNVISVSNYTEAVKKLYELNKGYIPTGVKYAVVDASKIKIVA